MNPNPNASQTRREGRLVPTPPAEPSPPRLATIAAIIAALDIKDRRAIIANPYGAADVLDEVA